MLMRKLSFVLLSIVACFSCISFSFADTTVIEEVYANINTETNTESGATQ